VEQPLINLTNCPSCGQKTFTPHLSAKDHTYSKSSFQLVKCDSCTLVFTNPIPDEFEIGRYYDNPEYVSHSDTKKGLLFTLYALVKSRALKQKRLLLETQTTQRTALDYGAGTGDFSAELANNGWSVISYEPDGKARDRIQGKASNITLVNSLETLPTGEVSTITLWHVLEHVHQLNGTLETFSRLLNHDGTLIIAVPNYRSFDAQFYKAEWAAYDVPRHLYHFDFHSMKTLVEKHGFTLKQTKPMWFDSTYVSLLSEKNINNPSVVNSLVGWIRALLIGALSNVLAFNGTEKCSSTTYIFKKVD
jgi:predicted SAM-dependent methyltransferase